MIYLLIDENHSHAYDFIGRLSSHAFVEVRPSTNNSRKEIQWLSGVLKVIRSSRKDDCLVFVFDFQAVLAWWICHVFGIRRRILCINLMLDHKDCFRNRFVSAMYRKALPAVNFTATVTSEEYGAWLNSVLGISADYCLLRDVYHEEYRTDSPAPSSDVFCGGRNGRDWALMLQLADSMPDVSFTLVVPPDIAEQMKNNVPSNATVLTGLSSGEFVARLAASRVVCLPLTKQAPAGLIVLFQAAANKRPVITSDTVTMKSYCSEGRGVLLPNRPEAWKEAISCCLEDKAMASAMAAAMRDFCRVNCSEEEYVRVIDCLLDKVNESTSLQ